MNTTQTDEQTAYRLTVAADLACRIGRSAFHKDQTAPETLTLMAAAREAEALAHAARCKVFAAKKAAR